MQFPYGEIVPAPEGFVPPEAWPEYGIAADPLGFCAREEVGPPTGGAPRGVRWSAWPLTFEEYVGDEEPSMAASSRGALARNRIITWKRVRPGNTPHWRIASRVPWRIDGFHLLEEADYTDGWQKNARREVRLWREQFLDSQYTVKDISWEEFTRAYKQSLTAKKTGLEMLNILGRKMTLPTREHIALSGVRNKQSGGIIAGTAAIYSPTHKSSVRFCPFMLPEARECYASTGLIDHWFRQSKERGTRYQVFTCFPQRGDPRGWRGPAEFKSHFGLQYVAYPPILYKFARGTFF